MLKDEKKFCYNCKSKDIELVHNGVRDNKEIDVLRCKNCELIFLSDNSQIDDSFYIEGNMVKGIKLENWIENTGSDDKRRFLTLKKSIKNKVLTDFGCGNAGFLNYAKSHCKKVYGIELQKNFRSYFEKCSFKVFNNMSEVPEKSDIITMFHVLEHIKDPNTLLKSLKPYLKDNGKIIIEVPNSKDALIQLYNCKCFQDFVYWSCHLFVFNEKSLKDTIKKAGYKISKFRYIQRYGYTNHLHWVFCHKPNGHKIWNKYNFKIINSIYIFILKLLKATDTIMIEITK